MVTISYSTKEDYWDNFKLNDDDVEFIENHLLELETPLTSKELVLSLIHERIRVAKLAIHQQRIASGDLYQPKGTYQLEQHLVFPANGWMHGEVIHVRDGKNPDYGDFQVIKVQFDDGNVREFAANILMHALNEPPKFADDTPSLNPDWVLLNYGQNLIGMLDEYLNKNLRFVRIAGRWFPKSLLININIGHLNLAEAVLDMADGGPFPTNRLLEQIEFDSKTNPKLLEFSFDLALQEDPRFDEVGPAGDVLWYLQKLEPAQVRDVPHYLRYHPIDYDPKILSNDMQILERELNDELSLIQGNYDDIDRETVRLILPHWISGTLPLSSRIRHLFPTAYEAPRIRFILVDGNTGNRFPGWVVRENKYVFGLKDWYEQHGLIPGSIFTVEKGIQTGEVIVRTESHRSSREWIRTLLIGSDGGVVFAMLKQTIEAPYDERMAIAVPNADAIKLVWDTAHKNKPPFEKLVVNMMRELVKLNPQNHVHAIELYAAINTIYRCPPGPLLALLSSRPWFTHVGDLHYRLNDSAII